MSQNFEHFIPYYVLYFTAVYTVNVLKFRTFYPLPFLPKFCLIVFLRLFLRILIGKANSVDPDQTALSGAV